MSYTDNTYNSKNRRTGILLHLSSLPSSHMIGDLGKGAHTFLDWLEYAGCTLWQMLPIGPTGYGNSPYSSYSVFAAHHLYISLEQLQDIGLLPNNLKTPKFSRNKTLFSAVEKYKIEHLRNAYKHFTHYASADAIAHFEDFKHRNKEWLEKYSSFMALKQYHKQQPWYKWEKRFVDSNALQESFDEQLNAEKEFHSFLQYLFFHQWNHLRIAAHKKGIILIGDIPIFTAHDSADVWGNPNLFTIRKDGTPLSVAGVPPDYFSENGQLWGNPLYDWNVMKKNNFDWWKKRFHRQLSLFDYVRVDHFRGFESYWEIPGDAITAKNGIWKKAPGKQLFQELKKEFGNLPVIAEDLGIITDEVRELRDYFDFPGMRVLQFGFDSCDVHNEFLPHNFIQNCVCYTGTHDNDTTLGWLQTRDNRVRSFTNLYTQKKNNRDAVNKIVQMAISSVADTVIIPMQDILVQNSKSRMNTPGKQSGNWDYRISYKDLSSEKAQSLRQVIHTYGR